MSSLDASQREISETLEGMIVVDAGPGTGKTHTVVERCLNILRKKDVEGRDVKMLTFTRNAAKEMRDRLMGEITKMLGSGEIDRGGYRLLMNKAETAYIGTFDAYCLKIVKESPGQISRFFRFDEALSHNAYMSENESVNMAYFRRFMDRFLQERGEEYGNIAALASENPDSVYRLLNRLMSRGILPLRSNGETDGIGRWFGGNDGKDLVGNTKTMTGIAMAWKNKKHDLDDVLDVISLDGFAFVDGEVTEEMRRAAVEDDRSALLRMIHDIYYDYIRASVRDDRLTFGLAATFAFIVLYYDDATRERNQSRYMIVDEFQDTNSNQLMICLMSISEPNLCVVGDWKQGIYGFRFVSIDNIRQFKERVKEMKEFLNDDKTRINFDVEKTHTLPLKTSYRSSQLIIDNAFEALKAKGTDDDVPDTDNVTEIKAAWDAPEELTGFTCVGCDDPTEEPNEVVRRIEQYVRTAKIRVPDGSGGWTTRDATYGDIAVLCRTTKQCRNVFLACQRHVPVFLQGDMEVMSTREGKLLLAWLRYINDPKDEWGIGPILADMNYSLNQIVAMMRFDPGTGSDHIPEAIKKQRSALLRKRRRITDLISSVYAFYGLDNDITQTINTVLSSQHRSSLMTIPEMISMIEHDMEERATYPVDGMPNERAVTIQTLHKSKGLEYPIVIIPGIDGGAFPGYQKDRGEFTFSDAAGVRCTEQVYEFNGEAAVMRSWKTALVRMAEKKDYAEERRLFFVGISRASQYVTLIAGPKPSKFFKHFAPDGGEEQLRNPLPVMATEEMSAVEMPSLPDVPERRRNFAVHDIMNLSRDHMTIEGTDEMPGKGMAYGTAVHRLAQMIIDGVEIDPEYEAKFPEAQAVRKEVDGLRAKGYDLSAEMDVSLPFNGLNSTVRGTIDVLAIGKENILILDWKTDVGRDFEQEYRLQLSVYAHAAGAVLGKPAVCVIDWLDIDGPTEPFGPLPMERIEERVAAAKRTMPD